MIIYEDLLQVLAVYDLKTIQLQLNCIVDNLIDVDGNCMYSYMRSKQR